MIPAGSAKVIPFGSAKVILAGSAKVILNDWTNDERSADAGRMAARPTEMHRLAELVRLHRQGLKTREVARLLGMSPNTERRYREALAPSGILKGDPADIPELEALKSIVREHLPLTTPEHQLSSVEEWRERTESLRSDGLGPRAIYDRLRVEESGFRGSLSAIKRLCLRLASEDGPQADDVAIPVETVAGEVAQVDFGYAGQMWDPTSGRLRKAWVFVMVLGHSRHRFDRVVFDQKQETWCDLHIAAFEHFGGVPKVVVPDNLKAAVIRAAFAVDDRNAELNRSYRELARHYGFRVDPTPPRSPKKKGKVENGVRYVKNNALKGREGQSIDEVNEALSTWCTEVAGRRVHGTTHKKPLEVFLLEERSALLPLPGKKYERVIWKQATVHKDAHVQYARRLYSVPWRHIGERVWLKATKQSLLIYADDERVATHQRLSTGLRSTVEEHLPEGRRELRHRSQSYWQERAGKVGPETARYIDEVFESDDVLYQLRAVQSIVTHLENYPRDRAEAACRRASHYGITTYQGIKNILTKALDREPLPTTAVAVAWADRPRFAREAEDFTQEISHERH